MYKVALQDIETNKILAEVMLSAEDEKEALETGKTEILHKENINKIMEEYNGLHLLCYIIDTEQYFADCIHSALLHLGYIRQNINTLVEKQDSFIVDAEVTQAEVDRLTVASHLQKQLAEIVNQYDWLVKEGVI